MNASSIIEAAAEATTMMVDEHHNHDHDHEHFPHHVHDHDHGYKSDAENEAAVLIAKMGTMVVLGMVSLSMGIIPMQVSKCLKLASKKRVINPRYFKYVQLLLGFGGGILFCTTFLHMMPEVEEGFEHLMEDYHFPEFFESMSMAKTLTCAGFFIMYLGEDIVYTYIRNKESKSMVLKEKRDGADDVSLQPLKTASSITNDNHHSVRRCCEDGTVHTHLDVMEECGENFRKGAALRGLLIVLGLSVHELLEGLAIGLESSAGYVWYMFGAVAAHKFIIAFCIGVELTSSNTRTLLSYIYVTMFAIVSPLGIAVGMCLVGGNSAAASGPVAVILQGLASGTLLYVVFFEILHKHRTGLLQYASILLGFAVMFVIQLLNSHSHHHAHHHSDHHHHHD